MAAAAPAAVLAPAKTEPAVVEAAVAAPAAGASGAEKLPTLAELEAETAPAPSSAEYWAWSRKVTPQALRLIESGALGTGEEFFRVSKFIIQGGTRYREARVRYELILASAALDHAEAQKAVANRWDMLLASVGRPLRTDFTGLAGRYPKQYQLDPAPASIQAVLRDPAAARVAAKEATDNAEVKTIRDGDQADRRADWSKLTEEVRRAIAKRDGERNARMREIIVAGELRTAEDFSRAALVMQHSPGFSGYQLAHELAVCSMLLGDRRTGRWLVAAAYDRLLGSIGHDQRFGTQYSGTGGGMALSMVDTTGICDAQRKALGCPTLEQARNRDLRRPATSTTAAAGGSAQPSPATFMGPNRALRDPQYGLAATVPEGWTLRGIQRWGDQQTTLPFGMGDAESPPGMLYYRVYRLPVPRTPEEALEHVRTEARKKQESRREQWADYTNRPEGVKAYPLGNYTAYRWLADYTDTTGKKCVELFVRFQTAEVDTSFFLQASAAEVEAAEPKIAEFMATLKLPTGTTSAK